MRHSLIIDSNGKTRKHTLGITWVGHLVGVSAPNEPQIIVKINKEPS